MRNFGIAIFGTALFLACSTPIPVDNAACPCGDGYQCCGQICIKAAEACPTSGEDNSVETLTLTSNIRCATMFQRQLITMSPYGSLAAFDIDSAGHIPLAEFPLPADEIDKCAFATDATHVYLTLAAEGTLLQLGTDNNTLGSSAIRFGVFSRPELLVVDDTNAYAIDTDTGRLGRVAKPTSSSAQQASVVTLGHASFALALAQSATALYVLDATGIWTVPKDGSQAQVNLASTTDYATSLTQQLNQLYWLDVGQLMGMALTGGEEKALTLQGENGVHLQQNRQPTDVRAEVTGAQGQFYMNPSAVSSDGTQLFVTSGGYIVSLGTDGSVDKTLVRDERLSSPSFFWVDPTRYVWVNTSGDFAGAYTAVRH